MNHCEYAKKQCIIEANKKVYQIPSKFGVSGFPLIKYDLGI